VSPLADSSGRSTRTPFSNFAPALTSATRWAELEEVAGTGVAQGLMEAVVDHARAAGHGLLTLWVRRGNRRARCFYEKWGLQPDGGQRSGPHAVLPIQLHEVRYRMPLEPRRPGGDAL
jgi:hypothetical protein